MARKGEALLKVSGICKNFGGLRAVDKASFEAEEGKITSIIGPNGAGKTTVFGMIAGTERLDSGSVYFAGREISGLEIHERARLGISRTFQHTRIFQNLSASDNVALALGREDEKLVKSFATQEPDSTREIRAALSVAGFVKDPATIATELSFGQRKLLALARSVAMPHRLLMLDEPVAGVNPAIRKKIRSLLLSLRGKAQTMLLIEHDMEFVMSLSDKVIVMHKGKVLAQGTPSEVRSNPLVLEAYLGD